MKHIFSTLILLITLATIYVWRAENVSFTESHQRTDHLPSIQLIAPNPTPAHNEKINIKKNRTSNEKKQKSETKKQIRYGAHTAPYDLSHLHIYGENEYCNNEKYKIKYMDVSGMYDTGTNTFYQILTKNCWGRETKLIDYITAYPPNDADVAQKAIFRSKAKELYDLHRPNVLKKTPIFQNVKWKPLTGKHHVISAISDFDDPNYSDRIDGIRDRLTLIIIKDPLTWFKSLCKASYEVKWHQKKFRNRNCPFTISQMNGTMSANMWHSVIFRSVMELWNFWYGAWMDSGVTISGHWEPTFEYWQQSVLNQGFDGDWRLWMDERLKVSEDWKYILHDVDKNKFNQSEYYKAAKDIPHLVIRYEDILFQPEKLINRLCKCAGGYIREGGPIIQESASKAHGAARGRQQALETYGNPQYRLKGYSAKDLELMRRELNDTLLKMFSYEF